MPKAGGRIVAGSRVLNTGLPTGWQELNYLCYHLLPLRIKLESESKLSISVGTLANIIHARLNAHQVSPNSKYFKQSI